MVSRLFTASVAVGMFGIAEASAHNVRMNENLSPYLHLTRTEFMLNGGFPVYQKLTRPALVERRALAAPASRQFGHQSSQSTFSPYHHLSRKNILPFAPMYHSLVRPVVESSDFRRDTSRGNYDRQGWHGMNTPRSEPLPLPVPMNSRLQPHSHLLRFDHNGIRLNEAWSRQIRSPSAKWPLAHQYYFGF